MLENWLQAPKVAKEDLAVWQLGTNILKHIGKQFPDIRTSKVAIIGINKDTDLIRQYLYQMAHPFRKFPIADIGNLRNPTEETLLPVLRELINSKIIPLVIGTTANPFLAQYKAYQDKYKKLNLAIIDERFAHHKDNEDYLTILRKVKHPSLSNLALIGYQSHLCPPKSIQYFQQKNYDYLRLGIAKANIELVEPAIRDAHTLFFNLSALKQAEAPGLWHNSPSGFSSEEACQLCHYAGMNDKLSAIGFYGYCQAKDPSHQTAQLIAQLAWYFLEGVYFRKKDFPVATNRMVEYIVALKGYDAQITFWKSNKSGRWWVELPSKRKKGKNELVPCSYQDYKLACRDELSDRLLNVINRYE